MSVIYYRHLVSLAKCKLSNCDIEVDMFQMPFNHYVEQRKLILQEISDKQALYVDACDKLKKLK